MQTQINVGRLILGGLLAGLIFNVGGISSAIVADLETAFRSFGWEPHPAVGFLHLGMRFVLGIVGVFVYVAMRPRFGAGPRTAVIAALVVWFVGYLIPGILLVELGVFGVGIGAGLIVWGIFEASIAIAAGAWLYRE